MGIISKYCYSTFEVINEVFTALGSGIFGLVMLLDHGFEACNMARTLTILCVAGTCFIILYRNVDKITPCRKDVIFITGCDSGLGYSLVQQLADMRFTVIAGFLNLKSKGAQHIKELYADDQVIPVNLDLTDPDNITQIVKYVEMLIGANNLRLHAVINNAGIMVFGEFEWLTEKLIAQQLNVNLMGTLLLSKAFCPLMRKDKGRFITISSHCALATLPGLSVYGATKAALAAWSDGLRVEMNKYGVKVITVIPGSFTTQSNIMANQMKYAYEMHESFTKEQKTFYDNYFKAYNTYLSFIRAPPEPTKLVDDNLYEMIDDALLSTSPKSTYVNQNLRYSIYHKLFKWSPMWLRDYFVIKFMQMPEYSNEEVQVIA